MTRFRWATCIVATAAVFGSGGSISSVSAAPLVTSQTRAVASSTVIPLLRVGELKSYATIDPDTTQGCNTSWCSLFYERLMTLNPADQLEPQLATSWEQSSPVTYVLNLRHGVKFWDGDEMTSADVVYSLDYERKLRRRNLR